MSSARPTPRFAAAVGFPAGRLVRLATAADEARAAALAGRAAALLDDAQTGADALGLPLTFLDAEILFDASAAVLQAVHGGECDADALFAALSLRHGLRATLHDLTAVPPAAPAGGGCGKPGCGSEGGGGCGTSCGTGGGCSTGSCSKGAVKSAGELTAYFAGLREQMEAQAGRVPLH